MLTNFAERWGFFFWPSMDQNIFCNKIHSSGPFTVAPLIWLKCVQTASLLDHEINLIKCQPINGASGKIKTGSGLV